MSADPTTSEGPVTDEAKKNGKPAETERLKKHLASARKKRVPFHLTRDEFLTICRWQLGSQYARSAAVLEANSERRIKRITKLAFAVKDKEVAFELSARLAILGLLPGVGPKVARAILTLTYRKKYASLDAQA